MILVLNEWIFHDLLGENGEVAQQETAAFLNVFHASSDKLALPNERRWMQKAYRLLTLNDAPLRNTCKQFHSLIQDSDRTIHARGMSSDEMPDELRVPAEDLYLIAAYLSVNADTLITTDQGLYEALVDSDLVSCQLRSEFMARYFPGV